jgi:hypothetical protein
MQGRWTLCAKGEKRNKKVGKGKTIGGGGYCAPNYDKDERFCSDTEGHKRLPAGDQDREEDCGGADAEPSVANVAAEEGQYGVGPRVHAVEEVVLEGAEIQNGGVGVGV